MHLKILFHSNQSTFGRDEDFSFFFQNIVRSSAKQLATEKTQTASCILLRHANKMYDVLTMLLKFARFRLTRFRH